MPNEPRFHPVYRSMNNPLTIAGAERRLFFMTLVMGSATFNFFGSLTAGLLIFAALYVFALWATATDPQILRIVLNSSKFRSHYDPMKKDVFAVERIGRRDPVQTNH